MKRYDKRQIMKSAWRLYKYVFKRLGKTFGDALKETWSVVKFNAAKNKPVEMKPVEQKVVKSESYQWSSSIKASDIYPDNNRGLMGSKYCGD